MSGHRPPDGDAAGYRAVFAVQEFRAVFAAHVLSVLGGVFAEVFVRLRAAGEGERGQDEQRRASHRSSLEQG